MIEKLETATFLNIKIQRSKINLNVLTELKSMKCIKYEIVKNKNKKSIKYEITKLRYKNILLINSKCCTSKVMATFTISSRTSPV